MKIPLKKKSTKTTKRESIGIGESERKKTNLGRSDISYFTIEHSFSTTST